METIDDVADWAGLEGPLKEGLLKDLGTPTKLRDIAFITRPVWDAALVRLRVETAPANADDPPGQRELTPVEGSRLEIFRRVVMLRMQMTPDTPGDPGVQRPGVATTPAQPPSSSQGSPTRKIKLSVVIDPTLDSEVVQLEQTTVSAMYAKYKSKFGDHPSPSALAQLLKANATPYADMSLWGPHGLRTLRKAVFKSYGTRHRGNGARKKPLALRASSPGKSVSKRIRWQWCCWRRRTPRGSKPTWSTSRSSTTASVQHAGGSYIVQTPACVPSTWKESGGPWTTSHGMGIHPPTRGLPSSQRRSGSRTSGQGKW